VNRLLALAAAGTFAQALPGYHFQFPRDHASHPAYRTEWWYYTGHLADPKGRPFGFELTFFRFGMTRAPLGPSKWRFDDLYVAHFAVTDEQAQRFSFFDRLNRPGLGLAAASPVRYDVHNGTWLARALPDGRHHLRAREGDLAIDLVLKSLKPPVIHGHDGVSQKADCVGCASHYYSLTRLETTGILTVGRERLPVHGTSWMDHEISSNQLTKDQVGWDWFSLQLSDGAELMLYRLRLANGQVEPRSSGTYVRPDGSWVDLPLGTWSADATGSWTSPRSQGTYPSGWRVKVPAEQLDLTVTPAVKDQELVTGGPTAATYWEGSSHVTGTHAGKPVAGDAYVELTGYAPGGRPNL
jgi:predicted secreted hydrolase